MASGPDDSHKRDQSEANKQPPSEPVQDAEAGQPEPGLFDNLDDFMPQDETPGQTAGSVEPTAAFVPVEPSESLEPFSEGTGGPDLDATQELSVGEPEATEAFAGVPGELTQPEPAGEGEEVAAAAPTEPGLAETVAFKSTDSGVVEALMPIEGETPAVDSGAMADGEPAAEGVAPLPEGGLLGAGLVGAETATGEPAAEGAAKPEEEEAEEEEAEKGPGILGWIGETSVYNVLLFFAIVALALGSLGLYLELKRYNFDMKAREGKQPIAAARDYGEPMTTAVA